MQFKLCLTPLQVQQLLGETKPEQFDSHVSFKAVLLGFTCDLCSWAESEEAGLSVEERKPEKINGVQRILSGSDFVFTIRIDSASTEQARQLISLQQHLAKNEWWSEHNSGFVDMHRTTMSLMGRAGTRTAPHVDQAGAKLYSCCWAKGVFAASCNVCGDAQFVRSNSRL